MDKQVPTEVQPKVPDTTYVEAVKKKLRNLRKKLDKIESFEKLAQKQTLNKDQQTTLETKPHVQKQIEEWTQLETQFIKCQEDERKHLNELKEQYVQNIRLLVGTLLVSKQLHSSEAEQLKSKICGKVPSLSKEQLTTLADIDSQITPLPVDAEFAETLKLASKFSRNLLEGSATQSPFHNLTYAQLKQQCEQVVDVQVKTGKNKRPQANKVTKAEDPQPAPAHVESSKVETSEPSNQWQPATGHKNDQRRPRENREPREAAGDGFQQVGQRQQRGRQEGNRQKPDNRGQPRKENRPAPQATSDQFSWKGSAGGQ
ncbi:hypothetical protein BLNAU_16120 [Blattamonas nauphoetae]|uniref:Uncharacterized protein n=1 Tax=Blattamonas nauphoetae TaxID=2049346 RepID=A0ABQ9XC86_9EUKA|nr:hypothetical protein BLNAU_16120 [Blattamonas nauphoetae]